MGDCCGLNCLNNEDEELNAPQQEGNQEVVEEEKIVLPNYKSLFNEKGNFVGKIEEIDKERHLYCLRLLKELTGSEEEKDQKYDIYIDKLFLFKTKEDLKIEYNKPIPFEKISIQELSIIKNKNLVKEFLNSKDEIKNPKIQKEELKRLNEKINKIFNDCKLCDIVEEEINSTSIYSYFIALNRAIDESILSSENLKNGTLNLPEKFFQSERFKEAENYFQDEKFCLISFLNDFSTYSEGLKDLQRMLVKSKNNPFLLNIVEKENVFFEKFFFELPHLNRDEVFYFLSEQLENRRKLQEEKENLQFLQCGKQQQISSDKEKLKEIKEKINSLNEDDYDEIQKELKKIEEQISSDEEGLKKIEEQIKLIKEQIMVFQTSYINITVNRFYEICTQEKEKLKKQIETLNKNLDSAKTEEELEQHDNDCENIEKKKNEIVKQLKFINENFTAPKISVLKKQFLCIGSDLEVLNSKISEKYNKFKPIKEECEKILNDENLNYLSFFLNENDADVVGNINQEEKIDELSCISEINISDIDNVSQGGEDYLKELFKELSLTEEKNDQDKNKSNISNENKSKIYKYDKKENKSKRYKYDSENINNHSNDKIQNLKHDHQLGGMIDDF